MKNKPRSEPDDMRAEYEFDYSTAVRGKYYRRLLKDGASVVVLEPDVAKAFRSSAAVNKALRSLLVASKPRRAAIRRSASGTAKPLHHQGVRRSSRR
jgi:hypothetical protein